MPWVLKNPLIFNLRQGRASMKTKQQYIYQILVFVSCLFAASWAQAATFDMVFFDNANKVVGNGQFTTDPNKIYTFTSDDNPAIHACLGNGQTLRECGLEYDFNNLLTKFSATIQGVSLDKASTLGVNWGLESLAWWKGARASAR